MVLAGVLACASCTHEIQSASRAAGRPAVTAVMARQVTNARSSSEGDLELNALRRRLAANVQDLDARLAIAKLYLMRGFPDLALEHYRLAATQFPDSQIVALSLGKMLRELGEREEALNIVHGYLARKPGGSWELLSLEGILEDEQGRFPQAEAAHRAALAFAQDRPGLHNNLGYNLLLQGHPDAAAVEFRRAIELDPSSKVAHNNLAAALESQTPGSGSKALAEWRRAGDPAAAHNNLAAAMIEQGRYRDARTELDSALRLRRDFPEALANLRLVSEKDGLPATLPAATPARSVRRKLIAGLRKLMGEDPKPAQTAPLAQGIGAGAAAARTEPGTEANNAASSDQGNRR